MKIGDKATNFTLQDTEGKEVSLSNKTSKGSVVLLFFPLAFSSVCTDEMCTVRDNFKFYKSLNAIILGISVDSFFTLKAFKQMNNIPFPLLSDFNKNVSKDYGVLNNDFYGMVGVAKRAAFVIDEDMKILHREVMEDAGNMPDFNAIHDALG
jgi:peroxiredoxin